jgi:hypothetical protein
MPTFSALEHIRARMDDAAKRMQIAAQNLQRAQQEHQAATHEYTTWQAAHAIEQKKLAVEQAQEQARPNAQPQTSNPLVPSPEQKVSPGIAESPNAGTQDVNKTEAIRELLRKHSTGMTPAEIWAALKEQVDRAYVYAVLKRLKDRKQITARRGKYYLNLAQKSEEGAKQQTLLQ